MDMFVILTSILIISFNGFELIHPDWMERIQMKSWESIVLKAENAANENLKISCEDKKLVRSIKEKSKKPVLKSVEKVDNIKSPYQAIIEFRDEENQKKSEKLYIPKTAECLIHRTIKESSGENS
jgi:hypothetical protein